MSRRQPQRDPQSLAQVLQHSSELASLQFRASQSQARLHALTALLPAPLLQGTKAAGLEDGVWHLLVNTSAAASKLRQMGPQMLAHLNANQLPTREIRVKITT